MVSPCIVIAQPSAKWVSGVPALHSSPLLAPHTIALSCPIAWPCFLSLVRLCFLLGLHLLSPGEGLSKPHSGGSFLRDSSLALHIICCLKTVASFNCFQSVLNKHFVCPVGCIWQEGYSFTNHSASHNQNQKSDSVVYNKLHTHPPPRCKSLVASTCTKIKIQTVHYRQGKGVLCGLVPSPSQPWTS